MLTRQLKMVTIALLTTIGLMSATAMNTQEEPGEQTNNFFAYGMYFDNSMKSWIQTDRTLDASIRAVSSSNSARSDVNDNHSATSGDTLRPNTTLMIRNMQRK